MSDNGKSLQPTLQGKVSRRLLLGFKLGLLIGMGGALTARDIAEELGISERHAYRFLAEAVEDVEIPVTGDGGYLRLQK